MATYIRGAFKDRKERLLTVSIVSPFGMKEYDLNDENSDIKICFDAADIEYEIDDMFSTIIKKRLSFNLLTTKYIGNELFSSKSKETTIEIYRDEKCIFSGYVEPYTFSQGYADVKDEFTLNAIDDLCCLEYEYLSDHYNWKIMQMKQDVISFKEYLSIILPTSTYFDMSKTNGGKSVFDTSGIPMKIFLGDGEDDMMTNEEVLDEILRYFNLHCMQIGKEVYIFDWNTLSKGGNKEFVNIFDNTKKTLDLSPTTLGKDSYLDDSTNISIADVYNQIQLKCKLDTIDNLLDDPLDADDILYYSNYKQMWFAEYISEGEGKNAHSAYNSIVDQGYNHPDTITHNYDAWRRNDWYFKLGYNPSWSVMYGAKPVEQWIEKDSNGNPINLHRILTTMKNYRFFPFIISCGKNEDCLNRNNNSRLTTDNGVKGKIDMSNYFVISVNGNFDDSTQEYNRIDSAIKKAAAYTPSTGKAAGLLAYTGKTSIQASPSDKKTKNYLIFKGSIILNPVMKISGWNTVDYKNVKPSKQDITFKETYVGVVLNQAWAKTVPVSKNGDGALYCHQFFGTRTPGQLETAMNDTNMIYPFVNEEKAQQLSYNYSAKWDSTDLYDKIDVLECELKIGDKYLVEEYQNGNKQKPIYSWRTVENLPWIDGEPKHTFTIGFDPEIGQKIVGKEYEITNTVNGKISDEKGMAIPISYDDALSGKIEFKILGPVNTIWNEVTRRHPSFWRSEKYYDNYRNLLSYVSSIWLKDFSIGIISDNQGSDVPSNEQDLVYISNMENGVLKKKDDLENLIVTMPTTEELLERGISTNVAENTSVNLNDNKPLQTINDNTQNISERPERLYVDQYWNIYSKTRAIIETNIDDEYVKDLSCIKFNDFGDTMIMKAKYNLHDCAYEITAQQFKD